MDDFCSDEKTEWDEAKNVIENYKKVLKKARNSGIRGLHQNFNNNLNRKLRVLQGKKIGKAQFCSMPNKRTVYIPDFYMKLGQISNKDKLNLRIIPTLIVPEPFKLLYNDENQNILSQEGDLALKAFIRKAENGLFSGLPLFIFKSSNKDVQVFHSKQELKGFLRNAKGCRGVVQIFVHSNQKISPIFRVIFGAEGKTQHFLLVSQSQKLRKPEKTGILNRLKDKNLLSADSSEENDFPRVYDSCLQESYIKSVSSLSQELVAYSNTVLRVIQAYLIEKNCVVKNIVVDFIKNSSKTWLFLSCPGVQLKDVRCNEIWYRTKVSVFKCEDVDEGSSLDQSSVLMNFSIERPKNSKFRRSNAYYSYSNVVDQFKDELGDKFRRVLSKLDNFKNLRKVSLGGVDATNRILEYKSYYNIDKDLNTKKKYLRNFASADFDQMPEFLNSKFSPIRKAKTSDTDTTEVRSKPANPLFASCSGIPNQYARNCYQSSIENLNSILVNIKKNKFPTVNFIQKYGEKFVADLEFEFLANKCNSFCPVPISCCFKSLLSCNYSIQYEKLLRGKHKPLNISEHVYSSFVSRIISCLEKLDADYADIEFLKSLFSKIAKYIIT